MPRKSFRKIDFILEIPHLNFQKNVSAVSEVGDIVYLEWFLTTDEAIGDWRLGHYHVASPIFKRKRKWIRKVSVFSQRDMFGLLFGRPTKNKVPAIKTASDTLLFPLALNRKTMQLTKKLPCFY